MSILTEPRKPTEPPMWLRDMTEEDFIAVAKERYVREVESGVRSKPVCRLDSEELIR